MEGSGHSKTHTIPSARKYQKRLQTRINMKFSLVEKNTALKAGRTYTYHHKVSYVHSTATFWYIGRYYFPTIVQLSQNALYLDLYLLNECTSPDFILLLLLLCIYIDQ